VRIGDGVQGLTRLRHRTLALLAAALLVAGAAAAVAAAKITSTQLGPKLCETSGGGKFVPIPGFPGEKIDRRLLADIEFLLEKYKHKLFITDGYSLDPVHSRNGEHPIGLALDIVPIAGAKWRKVSRLAKWAERKQNRPRPPFRWVGYNGDANHGRRNHLHLSWSHSPTRFNNPARTVYTIQCPEQGQQILPPPPPVEEDDGGVVPRISAQQRTAVPERR
jgi:hypothetical protein